MGLTELLRQVATGSSIPVLTALVLGLLTALSPCPMATNVAALAYVCRRAGERRYALFTGTLYTVGRMLSYSALGILIIAAGLEVPGLADFLQTTGEKVLGPLLLVAGVGMLLVDRLSFGPGNSRLASLGGRVSDWGMVGGLVLGLVFALAFCPYSAILFFGMLIPIALTASAGVTLPAVYAVGTGLPVLAFGVLISLGVSGVSRWFSAATRVERVLRPVVAAVFIGIGVYYLALWIG
jgi:cytochrome c biogenesis protein CcdA